MQDTGTLPHPRIPVARCVCLACGCCTAHAAGFGIATRAGRSKLRAGNAAYLRKCTFQSCLSTSIRSEVRTPAAEDERSGQTGATNRRLCLRRCQTLHQTLHHVFVCVKTVVQRQSRHCSGLHLAVLAAVVTCRCRGCRAGRPTALESLDGAKSRSIRLKTADDSM